MCRLRREGIARVLAVMQARALLSRSPLVERYTGRISEARTRAGRCGQKRRCRRNGRFGTPSLSLLASRCICCSKVALVHWHCVKQLLDT